MCAVPCHQNFWPKVALSNQLLLQLQLSKNNVERLHSLCISCILRWCDNVLGKVVCFAKLALRIAATHEVLESKVQTCEFGQASHVGTMRYTFVINSLVCISADPFALAYSVSLSPMQQRVDRLPSLTQPTPPTLAAAFW